MARELRAWLEADEGEATVADEAGGGMPLYAAGLVPWTAF